MSTHHTGLALSVRQPWADLLVHGTKKVEFRRRLTRVRGRIWVYATLKADAEAQPFHPRGVIVGEAELFDCVQVDHDDFEWLLRAPRCYRKPRAVDGTPQPMFWRPTLVYP